MKKELLIGCGRNTTKQMAIDPNDSAWSNVTTLDINPEHNPDVIWDLTNIPLPFDDEQFDEIHAYEVLEHTGSQGDYKFFFAQFEEFYRILEPNGLILFSVPNWKSPWALGDPSHTRVMPPEMLTFLSQLEYTKQVGITAMTDFRYIYKADFDTIGLQETEHRNFIILKAVKPSRIDYGN